MQNIPFLDSHVAFEKRSFVGIENDNIYTIQTTEGIDSLTQGKLPEVYNAEASRPRNCQDSVLVQ